MDSRDSIAFRYLALMLPKVLMFSSWSDYGFFAVLPQGKCFTLRWRNIETKELKPRFQLLLSHFDIDYNLKNLNNSLMRLDPLSLVTEMYFPMVKEKKKFKKVFESMEESPILL